MTGRLEDMWSSLGKRPPQGASLESMENRSVRLNRKNEPVVGRNIFHRARPCKGAKLTPWLWTGGTKEVRDPAEMQEILVDAGGSMP